ncbi:uncharacterized protein BDR25DRAFT_302003 [Lindgomyces ingoldianus]|uniref:Uncharacterized protein n=1 Tax=Lindgomyces ingoldianus TaxID=673940 RepID=A0ACB6R3P6_9PLEO|nr:uncharacterized protein BDR25DRAFT_302003 [Lindgomyces ingoldianus]KAF2473944.1 hypothetical protein BDR25DRAFT_302003 [Lindgomyces ingoldianus]
MGEEIRKHRAGEKKKDGSPIWKIVGAVIAATCMVAAVITLGILGSRMRKNSRNSSSSFGDNQNQQTNTTAFSSTISSSSIPTTQTTFSTITRTGIVGNSTSSTKEEPRTLVGRETRTLLLSIPSAQLHPVLPSSHPPPLFPHLLPPLLPITLTYPRSTVLSRAFCALASSRRF